MPFRCASARAEAKSSVTSARPLATARRRGRPHFDHFNHFMERRRGATRLEDSISRHGPEAALRYIDDELPPFQAAKHLQAPQGSARRPRTWGLDAGGLIR